MLTNTAPHPARFSSDTIPPEHAVIRGRHLTKTYGSGDARVFALRDVSIAFERGKFSAIMGPSGSGKSTLMHCLAGLDRVSDGVVSMGDEELTSLNDTRLTMLRRHRIGFVFQSFNLLPAFTAEENILMPLTLAGTRKPDREWFQRLTHTLGIDDRLHHRPAELSGGQQQRVAIARALLPRPDVIFADEPTGNLDSRSGTQVLGFLQQSVRELGQSIVMVTHDPLAAAYADRVVLLADGQLAGDIINPTADIVIDALRDLGE